jgi:HEAT repeat protein
VNDASTLLGALLNQDIQSPLHDDLFLTPLILTGRCLSEKPWAVERVFFMQVVERLFQALHCTPYTLARERIARTLVDMNNPQVRARLLWCLADAHVSLSVRESIGRAFGYASGQTLAPFLMELLRQPQTGRSIRIVIAHALGVLGESSVVHDLLILLRDSREDIYVRQSIASTLGLLGECLPELLQICQNKDEQALVLQRVVQACEKLRDPRATDVLCQLLRNSSLDWYVRGSSARALGKLAAKGAISTMLVLLQDRDENVYVRRCVAFAFGSFARADVPISHLLAILYNQDVDVSVRASLAQSFALMGDSSLVPYLLKLFALPSCPVRVRIQLALALGMLESPNKREVLHTLRTVAEQPDSGRDLYVSVIIAQGLAGESYVVDELLSLFIDEHLSQDMLSHVTRVLISVSNHETIDRHNIARKLVQLLLRSAQERYRGQCIVAALGELHDTEIVPDLCHLLTMTTIDRSIRCEIAACIAQLAQDEATEAKLYRLLAITDIRDDIYRTLWIVSRHVKRV